MVFWFIGTAVVTIRAVFRDPRFDYRLLIVGAVIPPVVDVWSGGAWVMHSLVASVALMVLVMAATAGRKPIRRMLLGLPIGTFMHLVYTGAWADTETFWWPFLGTSFSGEPMPVVGRGWWNVPLEVVGAGLIVWVCRSAGVTDRAGLRRFVSTGQLAPADVVH